MEFTEERPFKLTLEMVKENARRFYRQGRLTAQQPDVEVRECVYQLFDANGNRFCCAIGASFPKDRDDLLRYHGTMHGMMQEGLIECDNSLAIADIQGLHDTWAIVRPDSRNEELAFLRLII